MSDTNAIPAYGTLLQRGDGGAPEAFTTVAEIVALTPPPLDRDELEATRHDGPGWDEWIAGIKRAGQVTFTVNFLPTNATHGHTTGLHADYNSGVKRNYKIVFPDTTSWTFRCFVKTIAPSANPTEKLTAQVTLRISGAVAAA